jgi:hypothetical protein
VRNNFLDLIVLEGASSFATRSLRSDFLRESKNIYLRIYSHSFENN